MKLRQFVMSKKSASNWRTSVQDILEQQQRWQEQIDKMLKPQLMMENQFEKILESQRKWQEQINNILEPQRLWQQQIEQILEPQRKIQEYLDRLLEPQKIWQKQIDQLLEPQRRLQERIKSLIEPELHWQGLVDKYISKLNPDEIDVDPSGTITFSNYSFSSDELTAELDLLSQDLTTASSFQDYLTRLSAFLGRLHPPLAQILALIILPYIIAIFANLTTPIYQSWWQSIQGKTKIEAATLIKKEALSTYDIEELSEHRFVLASKLRVSASNNSESEIIDELPLGKIVKILKKKNRWIFIEYYDEDVDLLRQGWVFGRFLGKFTK
jgi:hypothetical protein